MSMEPSVVNKLALNRKDWFDNPQAISAAELPTHTKQAYQYLKSHTGWQAPSDLYDKVKGSFAIWSGSNDPKIQALCRKILNVAARFALPKTAILGVREGNFAINDLQLTLLIEYSDMIKGMMSKNMFESRTGFMDFREQGFSAPC